VVRRSRRSKGSSSVGAVTGDAMVLILLEMEEIWFGLANVVEPGDEKERLLRQAVALNGNLVSAAAASLLLRHHVQ